VVDHSDQFNAIDAQLQAQTLTRAQQKNLHALAVRLASEEICSQLHSWDRASQEPSKGATAAIALRRNVFQRLAASEALSHMQVQELVTKHVPALAVTDVLLVVGGYYSGKRALPRTCHVSAFDAVRGLFCLSYKCVSTNVKLQFFTEEGRELQPLFTKSVEHKVFAHTSFYELLAWFHIDTAASLRVTLTSPKQGDVKILSSTGSHSVLHRNTLNTEYAKYTGLPISERAVPESAVPEQGQRNGASPNVVRKERPWLLMDRPLEADDSAEHLYRHGQATGRRMVFLLDPASPDWPRLTKEGFNLVPFNAQETKYLAGYRALISTHLESGLSVSPSGGAKPVFSTFGVPIIHLGHGIDQHRVPRYFRHHRIDIKCVATAREKTLLTSPSASYLSNKEIMVTGLPRHDLLRNVQRAPQRILVMPTWRGELARKFNPKPYNAFAQRWIDTLDTLDTIQQNKNDRLDVRFLSHPKLRDIPQFLSAFGTRLFDKQQTPFRHIIATTALLITDYSSVAFDFALAGVPVIYFQPDLEEYRFSGHVAEMAFDYEQQGFGPVCYTHDALENSAKETQRNEYMIAPHYQQRVKTFFNYDDTSICERTWRSIEALGY